MAEQAVQQQQEAPLLRARHIPALALKGAVGRAMKVVSPRGVLPVLGGIRLQGERDEWGRTALVVEATDLEIQYRERIPVPSCAGMGPVVVPAKMVKAFLAKLPKAVAVVDIEGGEHAATLEWMGGPMLSMETCRAQDFPQFESELPPAFSYSLHRDLIPAIRAVGFAVATDETRPVLTGVHIRGHVGGFTMAATDSYRLAVVTIGEPAQGIEQTRAEGALIPGRALATFAGAVVSDRRPADTIYGLYIGETSAVMRAGPSIEVRSRLIEGQFPNYRRLIPWQSNYEAEGHAPIFLRLDAAETAAGITAVQTVLEAPTPLRLVIGEGRTCQLAGSEPGVGDVTFDLPRATVVRGEPQVIRFNPRFLADGLRFCQIAGGESVDVFGHDPARPFVLTVGDSWRYLLMPVRMSR